VQPTRRAIDESPSAVRGTASTRWRSSAEVLEFWERERIFERSLESPRPRDLGLLRGTADRQRSPGVHHVLSRAFKDVFPRFKTMQGHRVTRKGGWDTHGLPVEIAVEQELGFTNKQQIEEYGIAEFNRRCRETVFSYIQDWNELTERIAFWVDLEDAYVTYHNGYIESCWWVMKAAVGPGPAGGGLPHDLALALVEHHPRLARGVARLPRGRRPTRASSPPSPPSRRGPRRARPARARRARPVAFLAWTTTPWTLPANTGLAVHPDARLRARRGPSAARRAATSSST
jgi:isoleucyl-tRNA synthetase